ncbi:hypothetical protein [Streptomyces sp. NPDC059455]|uniref:HNH endonuclease n=1 Tax=Streptomyces sp. NPDC059455 TaxID=3346837 RepID=UPI0036CF06CF
MVSLPSADPNDPAHRRLRYIRYADDHLCGSKGTVQVHHFRALAELAHAGWQPSDWARVMLHRCRKTVVACDTCHDRIISKRPAKADTQ